MEAAAASAAALPHCAPEEARLSRLQRGRPGSGAVSDPVLKAQWPCHSELAGRTTRASPAAGGSLTHGVGVSAAPGNARDALFGTTFTASPRTEPSGPEAAWRA